MNRRQVALLIFLALVAGGVGWVIRQSALPPADFTFYNETEIKSIDPATVSGIPEHRILDALFEGLCRPNAEEFMPQPGVAESWDISDDETVYTFHLRRTALWSNGEQISAGDCVYGIQRTLNPVTAHRYAYQAWYLKNGKRYSSGLAGVEPSNPVEVELNLPKSAPWTRRGEVLYGKLIAKPDGDDRTVVVEIDGQQRRFVIGDNARNLPEGVEPCRQVLLDFREVGVEAIDNRTVRMTLESATPFWLQLLTHYALFPLFRPCIEEHGSPEWTEPENIVGNGAFRLQFRRIRDRIRFVKSETYWDHENVRLEVVDALSVDSRTTAFNMYETGQIDWATDTESLIVKELLRQDRDELDINPSPFLCTYFYGFNLNVEPLDDIRVRQALSLAIDRQEITATATGAGEIPAYSLVPPGIPGYVPAECEREDPEKARRLLAEAGYADGIGFPKLEIVYNSDETHQTIAELVRKQWQRNLGINVTMRNEEWGSYLNSQRQKKYDIIRRSWVGDYMDANTYIDMWVTGGENNRTDWGNPEYDRLVAAAAAELDDQIRLDLLHDAEAILMDEMPIMPMYYYVSRNLVRPYVRGIYNTMLDLHPLYAIYIDHDDPGPNEYMATSPHFRGKSAQEPAEVGP